MGVFFAVYRYIKGGGGILSVQVAIYRVGACVGYTLGFTEEIFIMQKIYLMSILYKYQAGGPMSAMELKALEKKKSLSGYVQPAAGLGNPSTPFNIDAYKAKPAGLGAASLSDAYTIDGNKLDQERIALEMYKAKLAGLGAAATAGFMGGNVSPASQGLGVSSTPGSMETKALKPKLFKTR